MKCFRVCVDGVCVKFLRVCIGGVLVSVFLMLKFVFLVLLGVADRVDICA